MLRHERRAVEGRIEGAGRQLDRARENAKSSLYSDSVKAAQECIELSIKAILNLFEIRYPHRHLFKEEEIVKVAEDIRSRHILESLENQGVNGINLPRILFLLNFWGTIYTKPKYGLEYRSGVIISPQDLFSKPEASLAVQHAEECYEAALQLSKLDDCKILNIVTQGRYREEDHPELDYLIVWNDRRHGIGPERPSDTEEVEGEIVVETISHNETENALGFWTEQGCFGTIQIHKGLRGHASAEWPIPSFTGRWWVKNLTMRAFRVVRGSM